MMDWLQIAVFLMRRFASTWWWWQNIPSLSVVTLMIFRTNRTWFFNLAIIWFSTFHLHFCCLFSESECLYRLMKWINLVQWIDLFILCLEYFSPFLSADITAIQWYIHMNELVLFDVIKQTQKHLATQMKLINHMESEFLSLYLNLFIYYY